MSEVLELKYGLNPNQEKAFISREDKLPLKVLNGRPGYINLLDALNGYQLVQDLKKATGRIAAASFKHVSPAGVAVSIPLEEKEKRMYHLSPSDNPGELASAYIRARGADRMSSFGDFIALSDPCDEETARIIRLEVSDGIIAPGYSLKALEILRKKKKGGYCILEMDPCYQPEDVEERTVYGIRFTQSRNNYLPGEKDFENIVTRNRELPESARLDLVVALLCLKYTQSNSVVYAEHGQAIGVGAGQQSRIHCTRLAGDKADKWHLRQHEKVLALPFKKELSRNEKDNVIEQYLSSEPEEDVIEAWQSYFTRRPECLTEEEKKEFLSKLDNVALASDAFFPFKDNLLRARRSGVRYVAQPGGSMRDDLVIEQADRSGMLMCFTGMRLFHH